MSKKNEMHFLTGLRKDFKRNGFYFYKIPDSPAAPRFMIAKPFDCFISIDGRLGAMEAKYLDASKDKSVRMIDLRPNQHAGLEEIMANGGLAWVFYQIKFGKDLRMYIWEYKDFVRRCNLKKHGHRSPSFKLETLEGEKYTLGSKNRFGVLEYDLGAFKEQWEMAEDLYG